MAFQLLNCLLLCSLPHYNFLLCLRWITFITNIKKMSKKTKREVKMRWMGEEGMEEGGEVEEEEAEVGKRRMIPS